MVIWRVNIVGKLLDLFNPLSWVEKAATAAIAVVLVGGTLWWFNSKIRDHYQAPLIAQYKAAADSAEAERLKREFVNKERVTDAKDAKLKTLEKIIANRKRIDAADDGLRNSLRPVEANGDELAACRQRADALDSVQLAIREFTKRVVQECDRHIADKEALKAAWPK
jgi:hypothetical protein